MTQLCWDCSVAHVQAVGRLQAHQPQPAADCAIAGAYQ